MDSFVDWNTKLLTYNYWDPLTERERAFVRNCEGEVMYFDDEEE